jgi:hypothetical protein
LPFPPPPVFTSAIFLSFKYFLRFYPIDANR